MRRSHVSSSTSLSALCRGALSWVSSSSRLATLRAGICRQAGPGPGAALAELPPACQSPARAAARLRSFPSFSGPGCAARLLPAGAGQPCREAHAGECAAPGSRPTCSQLATWNSATLARASYHRKPTGRGSLGSEGSGGSGMAPTQHCTSSHTAPIAFGVADTGPDAIEGSRCSSAHAGVCSWPPAAGVAGSCWRCCGAGVPPLAPSCGSPPCCSGCHSCCCSVLLSSAVTERPPLSRFVRRTTLSASSGSCCRPCPVLWRSALACSVQGRGRAGWLRPCRHRKRRDGGRVGCEEWGAALTDASPQPAAACSHRGHAVTPAPKKPAQAPCKPRKRPARGTTQGSPPEASARAPSLLPSPRRSHPRCHC